MTDKQLAIRLREIARRVNRARYSTDRDECNLTLRELEEELEKEIAMLTASAPIYLFD